jgi:hypothetical protein
MTINTYTGSCHCGAVRFEVDVDLSGATRCNCSICTKTAWLGAIVKPTAFRLVTGEAALGSYEWGHKIASRHFCSQCGVQCFARGSLEQLGGAYVSINVNALDGVELSALPVSYWDGRHNNWAAGSRDTPYAILAS